MRGCFNPRRFAIRRSTTLQAQRSSLNNIYRNRRCACLWAEVQAGISKDDQMFSRRSTKQRWRHRLRRGCVSVSPHSWRAPVRASSLQTVSRSKKTLQPTLSPQLGVREKAPSSAFCAPSVVPVGTDEFRCSGTKNGCHCDQSASAPFRFASASSSIEDS